MGLYVGLAGILASQAMNGYVDEAIQQLPALKVALQNIQTCGLFSGAAGIGLASLSIYLASKDIRALQIADLSYEYISRSKQFSEEVGGCYWLAKMNPLTSGPRGIVKFKGVSEKQINYGYANGQAGIAYFLGNYYAVTNNIEAKTLADNAIDAMITNGRRIDWRGRAQWGADQMDTRYMPYWFDGAAGIGSVLCRLSFLFGNSTYLNIAEHLVESAFCAFSVCSGQINGLAGILEFVNDIYICTKKSEYSWFSRQMMSGITEFGLHMEDGGIAFPGEFCTRISNDFATGSAGVGLALYRSIYGGSRPFMDFNLHTVDYFARNEHGNIPLCD